MRLELTTSCPPDKYASQLRYSPIYAAKLVKILTNQNFTFILWSVNLEFILISQSEIQFEANKIKSIKNI